MLSQLDRGAVLGLWGPFTSPPRSGSWVRRPSCRALDPNGVGSLVCRRHPSAQRGLPWCPVCYADVVDETFAPEGTAWSSAVVAIPVNDVKAPFALAYVDLDDGPRVLARLDEPTALPINTEVQIVGTRNGDLIARRAKEGTS